MKIINENNKVIGEVKQDGKNPFHFRYYGNNSISMPVHAVSLSHACAKVCRFLGDGHFYLMFTI